MKEFIVNKNESGLTLEKYVKHILNKAPLSFIYKLFRKKDVRINGVKKDLKDKVFEGDVVRIYISDEQINDFNDINKVPSSNQLEKYIVYEDENIIVINKPAGLLVQKDKSNSKSLDQMVKAYYFYKNPNCDKTAFTTAPAHRLDRNTSGLIIFGKSVSVMQQLMNILKNHEEIEKHYLTVVIGNISNGGQIDKPLLKNESTGLVSVTDIKDGGKKAITNYIPVQNYGKFSMLNVTLLTGRTHQIRVHLASINHPIVGDPKYGNFKVNKIIKDKTKLDHQILHAYQIQFKIKEGPLKYLNDVILKCPLDNKMTKIVEQLKDIKY